MSDGITISQNGAALQGLCSAYPDNDSCNMQEQNQQNIDEISNQFLFSFEDTNNKNLNLFDEVDAEVQKAIEQYQEVEFSIVPNNFNSEENADKALPSAQKQEETIAKEKDNKTGDNQQVTDYDDDNKNDDYSDKKLSCTIRKTGEKDCSYVPDLFEVSGAGTGYDTDYGRYQNGTSKGDFTTNPYTFEAKTKDSETQDQSVEILPGVTVGENNNPVPDELAEYLAQYGGEIDNEVPLNVLLKEPEDSTISEVDSNDVPDTADSDTDLPEAKVEELNITAYKNSSRVLTDNEGQRFVYVETWGYRGYSYEENSTLDNIIANSYDLKAMGIEVGSKEYQKLSEKVREANEYCFTNNGAWLIAGTKFVLPEIGDLSNDNGEGWFYESK